VKFLVDTNGWLGLFEGKDGFGSEARKVMERNPGACWISLASVWEAAIKVGLGKLKVDYYLDKGLVRLVEQNGFHFLGLELEDAAAVRSLEPFHRDPFDRIQVCQAHRLGFTILSRDPIFEKYGLKRIW